MSPVTQSPFGRLTSGLRQVSRNPGHFRTGRKLLLAEGILLIALGIAEFVSEATHPDATVGALVLAMTPWHSAMLLGYGVLAILGSLRRRAAITVTAIGAVAFAVLVIVGAVAAAHHAPCPLGLEPRDIVLHGALAALNFAVLYWLIPDVLEGPDWIRSPGLESVTGPTRRRRRPESLPQALTCRPARSPSTATTGRTAGRSPTPATRAVTAARNGCSTTKINAPPRSCGFPGTPDQPRSPQPACRRRCHSHACGANDIRRGCRSASA